MRRRTTSLYIAGLALLAGMALTSCQPTPPSAPKGLATSGGTGSACRVARVIDGDTVDLSCRGAGTFRARLQGYDTPEAFEPGCPAEARAARAATARLSALVSAAGSVDAQISGTDRFGRRLVRLSLDGRDVGAVLNAEGLAVPYGGGRRIDWCTRLG